MIRLVGITPEKARSFDEVKTQIETELRRQKVGQKFAAAADQFQNLVYEQADSLAPVAKALGLTVQTSPLVTRAQAQQIALGSAKLVQALFSPESIAAKRNTDAIEVGNGALMAARIVEYKPSAVRPFDDVKAEIHRQLVRQAASELAQEGRARQARAAGAGQERQGGRRRVLEARHAAAQPAAAGIHERGDHADLPGRARRSCRRTSAPRATAAASRSTGS